MTIDERTYLRACLVAGGAQEVEADSLLDKIFGPGTFEPETFNALSLDMQKGILEKTSTPVVVERLYQIINGAIHRQEYLAAAIAASAMVDLIVTKSPDRGGDL